MRDLQLPTTEGNWERYWVRAEVAAAMTYRGCSRRAFAAAHVVTREPGTPGHGAIDWDSTAKVRRRLWSLGLGVAEAMDTAGRGMGLSWKDAQELIRRTADTARDLGCVDRLVSGAGTDHLETVPANLDGVVRAYAEQCQFVESAGSRIVLMASRALAARASNPDEYRDVYCRVLAEVSEPVILHWLGPMFDPALAGYFGEQDPEQALEVCLEIIASNAAKVAGIKISLLDPEIEVRMRRRLPPGVRMFTGDDFHYPELIEGDEFGHSDALLGILDGIAPIAATALQALEDGDVAGYRRILEPTVALSRHVFEEPTQNYKAGLVFLAYLNGEQEHYTLLGGLENCRSVLHLAELFRRADQAGVLRDPELAVRRMKTFLHSRRATL